MKKILTIFLLYICWSSLFGQQRDTTLLGGTLKEASITSDKHRSITTTPLTLKPLDIRRFPALFSEVDPLKIILFTPGIQNNNEGDVNISIRGGDTDQSLISLDNIPLYNPSHLNGFISVINADLLSGTDIYKGGFPAKFGNRLSGVIDMKAKSGDMKGYHGKYHKYYQGYHLLQYLQLHQTKWTAITFKTYTISWYLQTVLKEGDAP